MDVKSEKERRTLISNLRNANYTGEVFKVQGGKHSYTQGVRSFIKQRSVLNIPGLVPKGMVFNPETQSIMRAENVLRKRTIGKGKKKRQELTGKLQKRFEKYGLTFDKRSRSLVPKENVGAKVSGSFNVTVRKPSKKGPITSVITFDLSTPWDKNSKTWKDDLTKQVQDKLENYNWEIIKIEPNNVEYFPRQGATGINMDSIRLQGVNLTIDGDDAHTWDTNEGKCVVDFLHWYYCADPKIPKDLLTQECFDMCFEENWEEEGVSIIELNNWAKMARIKMIGMDEDYRVIKFYNPPIPSKAKVLIFRIKNKHIHPVTNSTRIKSITESYASNELLKGCYKKQKEKFETEREVNDTLPVNLITSQEKGDLSALQYICRMMIENKVDVLGRNITWGKRGPESFRMNNNQFIFYDDKEDVVKRFVEANKEKYKGQKASSYVYKAMRELDIEVSKPNAIVNSIFNIENMKDLAHEGGKIAEYDVHTHYEEGYGDFDWSKFKGQNPMTFDINKCHTYILQNPAEKWIKQSFQDEIEPFIDFDPNEDLPLGMYYIETPDKKLFCGNKFYSSYMVNEGLKEGLIRRQDIKRQILSRDSLNEDYFVKLFEKYKEYAEIKEIPEGKEEEYKEISTAFMKILNNTTSGCFGKTEYHRVSKRITTDENQAYEYLIAHQEYPDVFILPLNFLHEDIEYKFWCYGMSNKSTKENNNLPVYNQILCQQAVMLYRYIKETTNDNWDNLLHRKSDAFTILCDNDNYKQFIGAELGSLKIAENPLSPRSKVYKDAVVDWSKYERDWVTYTDIKSSNDYEKYFKLIDEKKSLMTIGEAGAGKGFIIEKITEKYKMLICAPTNVAALRIKGGTLHKKLFYNEDSESIFKQNVVKLLKEGYEGIIIDEQGIVSGKLWRALYEVKKMTNIPFYLFGDWHQLTSVDGGRYVQHQVLKTICDYNITEELEYHDRCRMSRELRTLIKPLRCDGKDTTTSNEILHQIKQIKRLSELPMCNIVYTNDYKHKLNNDMNKFHYPSYKYLMPPKEVGKLVEKKYKGRFNDRRLYKEFVIHKDMPIICIKNDRENEEMKNGQRYKVIDFTNCGEMGKVIRNPTYKVDLIDKEIKVDDYFEQYRFKIEVVSTKSITEISLMKLILDFDLSYAMTNHKIIGDTITDYCIHQSDHFCAGNDWIYTALSRATTLNDVKVCYKYN